MAAFMTMPEARVFSMIEDTGYRYETNIEERRRLCAK